MRISLSDKDEMEKYGPDFWHHLGRLWDRATGGSDVAARPDADAEAFWPVAPRAAGLEEASEWFVGEIEGAPLPRFLFLVGGPGAGKSHAASQIVMNFSELGPAPDGLAHRKYTYSTGARSLTLVNDATIGSAQVGRSLAEDIDLAISGKTHLIACVNRGVLVEELANELGPTASGGQVVLSWANGRADEGGASDWSVETSGSSEVIRGGILSDGSGPIASIVAVYVDVCSLFERSIQIRHENALDLMPTFSATDYLVQDFATRDDSLETPGGSLFELVMERLDVAEPLVERDTLNPIAANLESLAKPVIRAGVVSILRAAEIVTSQRMTYREVWGAIARALLGELPGQIDREDLARYIEEHQPRSADPVKRLNEARVLTALRFSQAMFGVTPDLAPSSPTDPVTRLTSMVDPVLDALPGEFVKSWNSGWSTVISDALAGSTSSSPLTTLCSNLSADDPFQSVVTSFDRDIDDMFMAATRDEKLKDRSRFAIISWYGAYLMRLYAVAHGIPAFRPEVVVWTRAWTMSPNLPGELHNSLTALLRPLRDPADPQSSSLIPLFESRTTPVSGGAGGPKLALKAESIAMRTTRSFESVSLELDEMGKRIPPIVLDFSLVREALASNSGYAGITELSDATSPRLERFRAARLVAAQLRDGQRFRLVAGTAEEPITAKGTFA